MAEKATVAVIGCGGVAGYAHLPALVKMDNVQLVGVCDIDAAKAKEKADRFGGKVYTDYRKMLAELKPQRVHVLTPESVHVAPALDALKSGADVLIEKPLAESVASCRKLTGAANGERLIGIDYNYRFIPVMEKAHEVVRDGGIGDLLGISLACHNFCWHHCLDLSRWLAGPVTRVRATEGRKAQADPGAPLRAFPSHHPTVMLGHPMVASAQLEHEHGAITHITTTSQFDLQDLMFEMRLIGTHGWLRIDQVRIEDVVGRLRRFRTRHEEGGVTPASNGELIEFYPASRGGLPISFSASIRAFHRAADSRLAAPTSAEYGAEIVAIETAARKAVDEGRAVKLSEVM
ncbi:MAG: Inositol 2-dehydrogenase/D-chiro-inositol 3-dehydrogenase [Phycisphaerae bacterium]|nr:Inositol 2-dehydrogenase/D-chiro-inositol 3-dehydrogenase [Phycisphaerae bacterium]